eukprot:gene6099-2528_t
MLSSVKLKLVTRHRSLHCTALKLDQVHCPGAGTGAEAEAEAEAAVTSGEMAEAVAEVEVETELGAWSGTDVQAVEAEAGAEEGAEAGASVLPGTQLKAKGGKEEVG